MTDLFTVYPELCSHINRLCGNVPWGVTGVSALIHDERAYYFELTKPKHWRVRADGSTLVGIGGIGGSLEAGESVLRGLHREVQEELGVGIGVESAAETHLVYEQRVSDTLALEPRAHPRPALLTISANLYRRERNPEYGILAIVTFLAHLHGAPKPKDLFGLLAVPDAVLSLVFAAQEISARQLGAIPGVQLTSAAPLSANVLLAPVWTARSLQLLLQAGLGVPPAQRREPAGSWRSTLDQYDQGVG